MSHIPHDLRSEFPDAAERLHALKLGNAHFNTLAERYEAINHEVHRIESGLEAASDERAETLKKQRLALLDEVASLLAPAGK